MKRLQALSINKLIIILILLLVVPSVGLMLHAGLQDRRDDLEKAVHTSTTLLDSVAADLQGKVNATRQMLELLSLMPAIEQRDSTKVTQFLTDIVARNPLYANILVVDRNGISWAGKTPGDRAIDLSDRKAFKDAKTFGRFSFGEYVVGRSTHRPILNFAYPLRGRDGSFDGVIICGINLELIGSFLKIESLQPGTSFGIFDHNGVFLYRTVDPGKFIGKKDKPENFAMMQNGPDEGLLDLISGDGVRRKSAYVKLRLAPDQPPYAYIRGGTPVDVALQEANRSMIVNLATMAAVLALVLGLALLFSRRLIVRRIVALQSATQRLADGDLSTRVASEVAGGELGRLGQAFDGMAAALDREMAERERTQQELLRMQKLESLGVLAGGIAHDFNNILTGIMGNISFARTSLQDTAMVDTLLQKAEKASQRAAGLANQLLTFARGSAPVRKAVAARRLVDETLALVLPGTSVVSSIAMPDDLSPIDVDEGQMHQVFNNLFLNAVQAMPQGGAITVTATDVVLGENNPHLLPAGCYVMLTLQDQGHGIAEEHLKKVFDPYFTTKSGGKGLGLASAHSIIRKHGGSITVRSQVDTGTTFEVLLPASAGRPPEAAEPQAYESTPPAAAGSSILIMDDEEMIRDLLTGMLSEMGYLVITCGTGEEAIELYAAARQEGHPFAAVIMDLTIPGGLGGKEAAGKIRDIDPTACLVVSSGYSQDAVMADYAAYGFNATMAKPYRMEEVAKIMSELLPGG